MGMEKRSGQDYWNGGIILGYDNVNKQLVINKEEAFLAKKFLSCERIEKDINLLLKI